MKLKTLTIITLIAVGFGISNLTYAASTNAAVVTTLTDITAINKIEVHGNVELFISDGTVDQVKVYNKYYGESAFVQSRNGVLSISSYTNEKLVVWVTAADLRSVVGYDNAEIRSFGELSKIEFNVELHNYASAKINLDAFAANVTVNDHSKADLTGNANNFNLNHSVVASVNNHDFRTVHSTIRETGLLGDALNEDVAGI